MSYKGALDSTGSLASELHSHCVLSIGNIRVEQSRLKLRWRMLPDLLKFGASGNVIVVKQSYSVLQDITRMLLNIDLLQVMGLMVVVLNSEDCYRSDAVT